MKQSKDNSFLNFSKISSHREKKISGQDVTPFLLKRVNELSGGDSSKSSTFYIYKDFILFRLDVALIRNNAAVGAKVAVELTKQLVLTASSGPHAKVIAIGGTNVDIAARSSQTLELRTSNIGANKVVVGGVARNITECLCRLGLNQTLFISILGNDFYKDLCLKTFAENNMVRNFTNQ